MLQGTIGIENLKVTDKSLAKKAAFTEADKENLDVAVPVVGIPDIDDEVAADETKEATTAATIKKEEQHEPLLQENPQRFVLFPIKYHEVRDESLSHHASRRTRKVVS